MFAGVVHGPYDIRYEQVDTPVPQLGEVLVKVKYTGICGSDIPRVNGNACHFFPIILGHEFSGTVAAVGEGVTDRKPGDRVAGVPLVPCMNCEDCANGDYSLCKHYSFIGSRRSGSFAEYVALPAANTVLLGSSTDFKSGALFEPSTVALHGIRLAGFVPGKSVAVIGVGNIGALTLQWCRILGSRMLLALSRGQKKFSRCLALGADTAIDSTQPDWLEQCLQRNGGRGFDYVFETSGTPETMKMAYKLAGNHGRVCMIGTPKNNVVFSVPEWELLNRKELYVTGSWMSYSSPFPGIEWAETARRFESGELKVEDFMIDRILPLSQIADAFMLLKTPGAVKGKILIDSEA